MPINLHIELIGVINIGKNSGGGLGSEKGSHRTRKAVGVMAS